MRRHNQTLTWLASPVIIFGFVWVTQAFAHLTLPMNLKAPEILTWCIVFVGFISLIMGSLTYKVIDQMLKQDASIELINVTKVTKVIKVSLPLLYASILCSIACAIYLFMTLEVNEIGFLHSLKENLLAESGAGNKALTYLIYLFIYQILLTIYYFNCNGFQKNIKTALIFVAGIFGALMSGSRGLLIFYLFALIPCIIIKKHEMKFDGKLLKKFAFFVISFFFLYPFVFQGMSVENGDDWLNLFDYISTYLFSGIAAFNSYVEKGVPQYDCILTVPRPLINVLDILWNTNLAVSCPKFYDDILLPLPTNVYSIFFAPYHDFGMMGVLLYLFITGFLSQMAFAKGCSQDNNTWRFLYCIIFYSLAFSFFEDQFARGIIYYIFGLAAFASNRIIVGK
jgi:oligosaccharide repeat unit polymerase